MRPNGILTLTTDFGQADSYVGTMKGVILNIAPAAHIIDITHDISPQNVHQAAYIVQTFYSYYPIGTIHLVIVDPGVGSSRRAIALQTPSAVFVAPDNGVLTYVWRDALDRWGAAACQVVELSNPRFWLPQVSNTFHGRDVFAPAAAHLLGGILLRELGERLPQITEADLEQPAPGRNGGLVGRIIHVDHFGNCITNITPQHLEQAGLSQHPAIKIIDQRILGISRTFSDVSSGALIALLGSSNRLELAVRNGSAAQTLGVGIGDIVRVYTSADDS
jgi:S-adenosylmethionine hydrolase